MKLFASFLTLSADWTERSSSLLIFSDSNKITTVLKFSEDIWKLWALPEDTVTWYQCPARPYVQFGVLPVLTNPSLQSRSKSKAIVWSGFTNCGLQSSVVSHNQWMDKTLTHSYCKVIWSCLRPQIPSLPCHRSPSSPISSSWYKSTYTLYLKLMLTSYWLENSLNPSQTQYSPSISSFHWFSNSYL